MLNKLTIILLIFMVLPVFSSEVYYDENEQGIPLKMNEYTYLKFPRQVVEYPINGSYKILAATTSKSSDYSILKVMPLRRNAVLAGAFLLEDKSFVRVRFYVANDLAEKTYKFIKKQSKKKDLIGDITSIELFKTMMRQNNAHGYKVLNRKIPIKSQNKGIKISVTRSYKGVRQNGFIIRVVNKTKKEVSVDMPQSYAGRPNKALLGAVNNKKVKAGQSTLAFMVTRADVRPKDLIVLVKEN